MTATPEIIDILKRARDYPYDSPRSSYLYTINGIEEFQANQTENRTPVLAFGSNKAPSQLKRKFGYHQDNLIPVEMARLHDFDVVFAAHVTSYGAIPAMLQHCPGVIVDIAITWLTDDQLMIMHKSELYAGNYSFAQLENLTIEREHGPSFGTAYAYIGERGHYIHDKFKGDAISIANIPARNRKWKSSTTSNLLSFLHQDSGALMTEDEFILRLVRDVKYRRDLSTKMARNESRFKYPYQKKRPLKNEEPLKSV